MREPHPQSHVTRRPLGHVTTKRRYISTFIRPMDPKLSRILATLCLLRYEVCAEGNWVFQVSAYFYPSLSKKYNISNVKEAAGMQRKACACRK